ncbi:MAG: GNAT family N-acetyltransferase [Nitrospirae bacterium]|nr:GNAT family N-acetyltransferase [Nitrospirota bacterium]
MSSKPFLLRPLCDSDVLEYAEMLYTSFNAWYWKHGWGKDYFGCRPEETAIFYDIYNDLTPGHSIAAFDNNTGRMMGACFYHPREYHVSLGIMSVHPDYWRRGVGKAMVDHILSFTQENNYKACRLVGSAINMNSFSLYNRSGFIPRVIHNDMVINVSGDNPYTHAPGEDRVRDAAIKDVSGMGDLEMEVSGIRRERDYRYAIVRPGESALLSESPKAACVRKNPREVLHASVYENDQKGIDGFMISVKHSALNMMGPCVARTEEIAIALIRRELERFRGTWVLFVVPVEKRKMVEQLYKWGAVNVETHLKQVWGEFQPFKGVNMPSFLPETG